MQHHSIYLVSETTINNEIDNDTMLLRLPMSEMTINYSSGYDATRLHLTLFQEDDKLFTSSLRPVQNDDKLPTLIWLNATALPMSEMVLYYQIPYNAMWLCPLHICDDIKLSLKKMLDPKTTLNCSLIRRCNATASTICSRWRKTIGLHMTQGDHVIDVQNDVKLTSDYVLMTKKSQNYTHMTAKSLN